MEAEHSVEKDPSKVDRSAAMPLDGQLSTWLRRA